MVFKNVPGVFIEEVSLLPPSVAGVETGIPAFIGYTAKAETPNGVNLTLKPTRINSLRDYEDNFGKAEPENDLAVLITDAVAADGTTLISRKIEASFKTGGEPSSHNMYYAMQLYFSNGGGPCYIVSVKAYTGTVLKSDLSAGLEALSREDEPTMIVFPEAISVAASSVDDYFTLYNEALAQCADLKDRVTIIDVIQGTGGINADINTVFRKNTGGLQVDNLKFGAAYYPYLKTTVDYDYTGQESTIIIKHTKVKPDATTSAGALEGTTFAALKTTDNLVYEKVKAKLSEIPLEMPPSPAIAGVYARVDSERGVWKAPANVGISSISGASLKVADADQNYMNIDPTSGKSVNAIREITGRGTVVWGARTLDGNSNEWRYINVRRFFNFVEESVKKATYRFVFEPNDANTWVKVRAMIENFLTLQWRAGALQGAKPEHAFFVRVGLGQTMTPLDILEGRLIVEIGMAVARPAEFIILRFMHKMPES